MKIKTLTEEKERGQDARKAQGTQFKKKDLSKSRTISMTDREWEIFLKNGGTKNLRRLINLGKFRKII